MKFLSSSEEDNKRIDRYISTDGTIQKKMQIDATHETAVLRNISREEPSPTGYTEHKFSVNIFCHAI